MNLGRQKFLGPGGKFSPSIMTQYLVFHRVVIARSGLMIGDFDTRCWFSALAEQHLAPCLPKNPLLSRAIPWQFLCTEDETGKQKRRGRRRPRTRRIRQLLQAAPFIGRQRSGARASRSPQCARVAGRPAMDSGGSDSGSSPIRPFSFAQAVKRVLAEATGQMAEAFRGEIHQSVDKKARVSIRRPSAAFSTTIPERRQGRRAAVHGLRRQGAAFRRMLLQVRRRCAGRTDRGDGAGSPERDRASAT